MANSPYIELRAHTAFSFGDGSVTPETLVERAAALGYSTLGITDTADVGGLVRAVLAGRAHDVRILAGAELRVDGMPMAFLARDAEGFSNLAGLVTQSRVGAWGSWEKERAGRERGRPNITRAQLFNRSEGLYALTGPHRARWRRSCGAATARAPTNGSPNFVKCSANGSLLRCSCIMPAARNRRSRAR